MNKPKKIASWTTKPTVLAFLRMTLKQQVHNLVGGLPDDSPLLVEVREMLRLNRAIGEAMDDVREGRTYEAQDFLAKVQQRWPRKNSE